MGWSKWYLNKIVSQWYIFSWREKCLLGDFRGICPWKISSDRNVPLNVKLSPQLVVAPLLNQTSKRSWIWLVALVLDRLPLVLELSICVTCGSSTLTFYVVCARVTVAERYVVPHIFIYIWFIWLCCFLAGSFVYLFRFRYKRLGTCKKWAHRLP